MVPDTIGDDVAFGFRQNECRGPSSPGSADDCLKAAARVSSTTLYLADTDAIRRLASSSSLDIACILLVIVRTSALQGNLAFLQ